MRIVPIPRLLVNRLPHTPQHLQRTQIILLHKIQIERHQRPNRGRRRVKMRHAILLHHFPEPPGIRIRRRPLKNNPRRPIYQRSIQNITVPGNPPSIRRTPIHIILPHLKHIAKRVTRVHHIPATRMQHPLRLARRPRRIQNKQRIFGIHLHRLVLLRRIPDQHMPPLIPPLDPRDLPVRSLTHNHTMHRRAILQRLIRNILQWHMLIPTPQAIIRNQHFRITILNPLRQRLRRKSGKHNRMHRPHPCTRQRRNHQLRRHRHIDTNPIPLLDPLVLQHIRKPAHILMQLPVRNRPPKTIRMIRLKNKRRLVANRIQMPIQRIFRDVHLPPLKPRHIPLLKPARMHLIPRFAPIIRPRLMLPKL